jgi:ribosomal protein S18 acetylase RimI-like enzyme
MPMKIQAGFEEAQRNQVAQIYCKAFERKFTPLYGKLAETILMVGDDLNPACCFTAVDEAGQVLGVAGFQHRGGRFLHVQRNTFVQKLGWLKGLFRYSLQLIFERPADKAFLQMDGIAVTEQARGLGVGSQLIASLTDFATQQGYSGVRLDVVNTNPHAQRLYERLGFVAMHTQDYPYLRSLGFSQVTTMVKTVTNVS